MIEGVIGTGGNIIKAGNNTLDWSFINYPVIGFVQVLDWPVESSPGSCQYSDGTNTYDAEWQYDNSTQIGKFLFTQGNVRGQSGTTINAVINGQQYNVQFT